ncbi:MAG: LCP family protein [Candidatus Moranbacteria bacterium]|nr:LCP family protein [Candidatus Moranbacteria bacterium]
MKKNLRKKTKQQTATQDYKKHNQTFNAQHHQLLQNLNAKPINKSPNFQPQTLNHSVKKVTKKSGKFILISSVIFFIGIIFLIGFYFFKTKSTLAKISGNNVSTESVVKSIVNSIKNDNSIETLDGFDEGKINILLLGVAGDEKPGKYLTDTIMIASIDTKNFTVGLLSLPRDLLIKQDRYFVKINILYQSGLKNEKDADLIIETVEKITDQEIHYYLTLDFAGFTQMIDTLDGINVDVKKDIKDTRYPGPNYSYETFEIEKGLQNLDGKTALKYARTRHTDIEGDFGRAKRQQQILQAVRNKSFSLETFLNPFKINELLNTLGDHVHTNISGEEIGAFIELSKKVDTQNISNVVVDAWKTDSILRSTRLYFNGHSMSGLITRTGNYSEIKELAENIFDIDYIKERKDKIKEENVEIILINTTEDKIVLSRVKSFLKELGLKNIETVSIYNDEQKITTVIDYSNGNNPFSLDEIIKKIPAEKVDEIPDGLYNEIGNIDGDFVIVLGSDIIKGYGYDEISQNELE